MGSGGGDVLLSGLSESGAFRRAHFAFFFNKQDRWPSPLSITKEKIEKSVYTSQIF